MSTAWSRFRKVLRHKRVRVSVLVLLAVLLVPYLWSRVASPWRRIQLKEGREAVTDVTHDQGTVRVACYNIAHGRGLSAGNWTGETKRDRLLRLDAMAALLAEIDADVVVLNEVDFQSSWSHGINQAQYLAERSRYQYWCEQRNLDFRLAMLTWRFGNAILSRYPITEAAPIDYPAYQGWESWLAGRKRGVLCRLELPDGRPLLCVAAHLSHRSEDVRVASIKQLCQLGRQRDEPLIIAGDFNSTPTGFPGSRSSSGGENAMDVLDAIGRFRRSPEQVPEPDQLTFPSVEPKRVIDWIVAPNSYGFERYVVVPSELSDHRPVVADLALPPRK